MTRITNSMIDNSDEREVRRFVRILESRAVNNFFPNKRTENLWKRACLKLNKLK